MKEGIEKAKVLSESLPYIRKFYNKTVVIKYGGHAMVDESLKEKFALDIILMKYIGINPVIVHGGGPQIGEFMDRLGMKTKFVDGLRVTDKNTIDIVEMVLVGKINKEIVGHINQNGGKAVGLSGKDGNFLMAEKIWLKDKNDPSKKVDIGMVGEVKSINPNVINTLDTAQFIPVIAPLGAGEDGETYNINADTAAGEIASALKAEKLILLTDVEGVKDKNDNLLSTLTEQETEKSIEKGAISGGMIPKVNCCCKALDKGVGKAHIIDGRVEHAVLLEIFTDVGIGTQIVK